MAKTISRRGFLGRTSAGLVMAPGLFSIGMTSCNRENTRKRSSDVTTGEGFSTLIEKYLPAEESYDHHKKLTDGPVHKPSRDLSAVAAEGEMTISDSGWKVVWSPSGSIVLQNAVQDFTDYLSAAQNVKAEVEEKKSLDEWQGSSKSIIIGTRDQLPGCGSELKGSKDYEIITTPDRVVICGFDDRGAMFGLYNLESRMNLREAPILPSNLRTVRHSLFKTRMALSWMGWMDFPDVLLSHMAHDGFDGIFAGVYTNPNGDRTTAETSTDFYARALDRVRPMSPVIMKDLINRAAKYGIKVYTQICYQYMGTPESAAGLRKLVKDILREFPDIKGYVLLTEGFWYKKWGGGHGASREYIEDWARNWSRAVAIVEEECHKVNPETEVLPWEYNIDFSPKNTDVKRFFIKQLPVRSIPMLTWENGKGFEIDGMAGFLRDYSLNQVGPAEVTMAQIDEANTRGMTVYSKVDTFASWQYGTIPYLPCPYQWYERYKALEKYGVKGSLESWSSGYKPNIISNLRAWTCWTDDPQRDELFSDTATMIFGKEQKDNVLKAWDHFSKAIRLVPDTGPNMGTNNAIGNPLFFTKPQVRSVTYDHSWSRGSGPNPYWPFTVSRMVFFPDLTNKTNRAESYARGATGIQAGKETKILPVFLKYLKLASDEMEAGLKLYREAAANAPESKKEGAVREVSVAEQMQRMMQSDHAILEFEDTRLQFVNEQDNEKRKTLLNRLKEIVQDEISRTELALIATSHDSRFGFQFEQDYVFTPYSLKEKLALLNETLNIHLADAGK